MDLSYWLSLLGIAVGLAMDAFAVSIAAGLAIASVTPRHVFRISFHFGLFQFIMPIIGWLAGGQLRAYAGDYNRWVAFGLLGYVGGRMLWEARSAGKAENERDLFLAHLIQAVVDGDVLQTFGNASQHQPRREGRHDWLGRRKPTQKIAPPTGAANEVQAAIGRRPMQPSDR